MAVILDISTAVPEYCISKENLVQFYARSLEASHMPPITKKLGFLLEKTKISDRYSCIPDFDGKEQLLFTEGNYNQPAERRMDIYKQKSLPLSVKAIDALLLRNKIEPKDITHLITVSCTGLFAPGLEILLADHYGLQHTEKSGLNFLGCYAALKALKQAHYIAQACPDACVLIVSVELCSLHFIPSVTDEDIVANLLFADGAAAVLVCGDNSNPIKQQQVLNIDTIGAACIPGTAGLMTWDISATAFRMYLSKQLVRTIKDNIEQVVGGFLKHSRAETDYWAIHPGGVKIVEAVQESLQLQASHVEDSMHVLKHYGNMSSPTILFILHRILEKIRASAQTIPQTVFACAFGPGLTVEMIQLSSVAPTLLHSPVQTQLTDAVPA